MSLFDDAVDAYKTVVGTAVKHVPLGPPGTPAALFTPDMIGRIRNGIGEVTGWNNEPDPVAQQAAAARGGGNRGVSKQPILDFIMRTNPSVTSKRQARQIRDDFTLDRQLPGLADYARSATGQPDPNTMQMFFAKTVQPYLEQTNQRMKADANAGYLAMQNILSGAAGSPALDVVKAFLPMQQAGVMQQADALDAATRTAPAYDALLNALNENIQQQQRAAYYQQALAASGGQQQNQPSAYAQALAGGSAQQAAG